MLSQLERVYSERYGKFIEHNSGSTDFFQRKKSSQAVSYFDLVGSIVAVSAEVLNRRLGTYVSQLSIL